MLGADHAATNLRRPSVERCLLTRQEGNALVGETIADFKLERKCISSWGQGRICLSARAFRSAAEVERLLMSSPQEQHR